MAKLNVQQVRDLARSIIAANPGGIRFSALVETISKQLPETPKNTIHGSVWNLDAASPNEIAKPSRGFFTPISKLGDDSTFVETSEEIAATGVKVSESDFYEPFAQWLKNDLEHGHCSRVTGHSEVILPAGRARSALGRSSAKRSRSHVVGNVRYAWLLADRSSGNHLLFTNPIWSPNFQKTLERGGSEVIENSGRVRRSFRVRNTCVS